MLLCLWSIAICSAWAADGDYVKVSTAPENWTGEYLIVYEVSATEGRVMKGAATNLDVSSNYETVVINEGVIALKDNKKIDLQQFSIEKDAKGKYTIQSASGLYIANAGTKNGLSASKATAYQNDIAMEDGKVIITSLANNKASYLQYNKTSDQARFRYFTGKGSQQPIALYKKVSGTGKEKTLVSVTLNGTLAQTEYLVGESFDPKGLKLDAIYDDGTKDDVTDQATWEWDPKTLTEAGDQTVLVQATFQEVSDLVEYDNTEE